MKPIISIIIPVYNVADYLSQTLDNILSQRGFDKCELLLLNDGSTDNSLSILHQYKFKFDNIRIINKPNEGVSATRNCGLDLASGEYVYFMDSDDMLHPQTLEIIIDEIEMNHADMVTWNFTTFYSKPKFTQLTNSRHITIKNEDKRAFNFLTKKGCAISLWNKAIRRSLFENPKIRLIQGMSYGEDMFVSWKCIIKANVIRYIDAPIYYYRQTGNSAVSRFHDHLYETYRFAFDDFKTFVENNHLTNENLIKDIDYHFARRIPALTAMETRAPYDRETQEKHLTMVLNDEYICRALEYDDRLTDKIYNLARQKKVKKMLAMARRDALKAKLLFPLKKLLK